jgi:hypothetical protein
MPTQEQRITGRRLRYQLTLVLHAVDHPMTVEQLIGAMDALHHPISGRASKTVSDALRWEVRRGRVRRAGRSTYRAGATIPRTTRTWMRAVVDGSAVSGRAAAAARSAGRGTRSA